MMYGYGHGHGMSAWGWFAMASGTALILALLVVIAVMLYRLGTTDRPQVPSPPGERAAEDVLAERFARGEIDETEYRSRLAVLRSGRS